MAAIAMNVTGHTGDSGAGCLRPSVEETLMRTPTSWRSGTFRRFAACAGELFAVCVTLFMCAEGSGGLAAQAAPARLATTLPSYLFLDQSWHAFDRDSGPLSRIWVERADSNYHREGAVIGTVIGAVGLAILGNGLCQSSDAASKNCTGTTLGSALLGGAAGFTLGLLIGGQFPKGQEADSTGNKPDKP
jgi:hypothetical protein